MYICTQFLYKTMKLLSKQDIISGISIDLPTSKSISNRVLIINELAGSQLKINNLSQSDDTQVLANILRSDNSSFDVDSNLLDLSMIPLLKLLRIILVFLIGEDILLATR